MQELKPQNIQKKTQAVSSLTLTLAMFFVDLIPTARETKAKHKSDYIKLRSFCKGKESINKMKRKPTKLKKILANHTSEELISKPNKKFIQLNKKNANNLIKKWVEDLNRYFPREDIQMTNKHIKRYLTSQILGKCKPKQQ